MKGNLSNGLVLVVLGIFSMWLFYTLGEADVTGPIFVIILGIGAVYASIKENRKQSKRRFGRRKVHVNVEMDNIKTLKEKAS